MRLFDADLRIYVVEVKGEELVRVLLAFLNVGRRGLRRLLWRRNIICWFYWMRRRGRMIAKSLGGGVFGFACWS